MNNLQKTQAIIFDFNRTIYDPESLQLMQGTAGLLQYCWQKYDCYLVSFNENNRESLFDDLDIRKFFRKIALVDKKEKHHFIDIVSGEQYKKIYVIGDRVKAEIKIGNELGFETIWLRRGKFQDELPTAPNEQPKYIITSLQELKNIL